MFPLHVGTNASISGSLQSEVKDTSLSLSPSLFLTSQGMAHLAHLLKTTKF